MRPWYIGNTSVRSALRLRDGLLALESNPGLQGRIRGREGDIAFRNLLGERGVVSLGDDGTASVGRKWRAALGKLGFLYPDIPPSTGIRQEEVGALDWITSNGWRLIQAETVPAMQECFLRAMAAQYMETEEGSGVYFSPLLHTLSLLLELEKKTGAVSSISFIEMALCVQTSSSADDLPEVVQRILDLRTARNAAESKRRFDTEKYDEAAQIFGLSVGTFRDYADTNIRYLKATGLVQSKGRGIALVPEKQFLVELLVVRKTPAPSALERYQALCNGATLPTDSKEIALEVLDDLKEQLKQRGLSFSFAGRSVDSTANINVLRHDIEDMISKDKEEKYAETQAGQWKEIVVYLELIASNQFRKEIDDDTEIVIPKNEVPAYLEWILWRAFLAINSLTNKPYESRRFRVDQDFLPIGTAPGGGPDLIFEFEDFVLVVEVTLTDNSRQEAAEGEPVRRHVAAYLERFEGKKPVYGLFIARRIDSNTAETFRIGAWYTNKDRRLPLEIIPMTIDQFGAFFKALFEAGNARPQAMIELMKNCEKHRPNCEAPQWKEKIEEEVRQAIGELRG